MASVESTRRAAAVREGNPLLGLALCAPLMLFLAVMLVYPLGMLARQAFAGGAAGLDAAMFRALRNSVLLSAAVAALSTFIGLFPAWALARTRVPGAAFVRVALTLPLTFSGVVVGFLAILMLGRVGFVPRMSEQLTGVPLLSGAAYGAVGLLLAYLYFEIPRAALAMESAFRQIDPLYDAAAATLGAPPAVRLRRLILPLTLPAMLSTLLITFSVSLGSFGVALMLSRRLTLLPVEIYTAFTGFLDDRRAAVMSLLLIVIALLASAAARAVRPHA